MLLGPDLVRECGHCTKPFVQPTLLSGNTFGATVWTDGKREAPMLPETPRLVKCPHCGQSLWLDEANKLGEKSEVQLSLLGKKLQSVGDERWSTAPRYEELGDQDYLRALQSDIANTDERLRYIRVRAWWAANDCVRRKRWQAREDMDHDAAADGDSLPDEARANMELLLAALSDIDDDERLMKAELARELGRFDEAERLLSEPFVDRLKPAAMCIRGLAKQRRTKVATLGDALLAAPDWPEWQARQRATEKEERARREVARNEARAAEQLRTDPRAFFGALCALTHTLSHSPEAHPSVQDSRGARLAAARQARSWLSQLPLPRRMADIMEANVLAYGWPANVALAALGLALVQLLPQLSSPDNDAQAEWQRICSKYEDVVAYLRYCLRDVSEREWQYRPPLPNDAGPRPPNYR